MESDLPLVVLGLGLLLALSALILPMAERLNFPFTVLLAAVGILLGLGLDAVGTVGGALVPELVASMQGLSLTAEAILFVFLPTLLFESALSLDARRLMRELGPILILAVIGLLVSTVTVALVLRPVSGETWLVCLLLGTIVSATDPVAVVAMFRDLGAPKRLTLLVEGESLFNDATAIVLFTILAGMLAGHAEPSLLGGLAAFLQVFVGGILVGLVMARITTEILARLPELEMVETSMTVALAYLSFLIAEHYLHVSGVMATVTAGLVVGSAGRTVISRDGWEGLTALWERLGFWANSLIFLLVGMRIPELLEGFGGGMALSLIALVAAALGARALILFGMLPAGSLFWRALRIAPAYRLVMWWGGLRGAVSLALALLVLGDPDISESARHFVAVMVTSLVLFTLFVNAPGMRPMLRTLGLDRLPTADLALRNRLMADALRGVEGEVTRLARDRDMDPHLSEEVGGRYRERVRQVEAELAGLEDLGTEGWVRTGLRTLLSLERQLYLERYDEGVLPGGLARVLLGHVEQVQDAVRANGTSGYLNTAERGLAYGLPFRLSLHLHRRIGWQRPLAAALARRLERIMVVQDVLRELSGESFARVEGLVGEEASRHIEEALTQRRDMTREALEALRLQYPDYARALEENSLEHVALHLEAERFERLLEDAVIGHEIHRDLMEDVRRRLRETARHPRLDLGLEPARLLERVPLLQQLPRPTIASLAERLRSRLALPGETVVRRGETGREMYFISSGAVRVELGEDEARLGSGDFFGELALVTDQPRNADVVALCYCELLVLAREDFESVMADDQTLRDAIRRTAAERLARSRGERSEAEDPGT